MNHKESPSQSLSKLSAQDGVVTHSLLVLTLMLQLEHQEMTMIY